MSRKEYSICSCRVPSSGGYGEELISFYVSGNEQARIIEDVKCGRSPSEDPRLVKAVLHEDLRKRNEIRKIFTVTSFFISAVFGLVAPFFISMKTIDDLFTKPLHTW